MVDGVHITTDTSGSCVLEFEVYLKQIASLKSCLLRMNPNDFRDSEFYALGISPSLMRGSSCPDT